MLSCTIRENAATLQCVYAKHINCIATAKLDVCICYYEYDGAPFAAFCLCRVAWAGLSGGRAVLAPNALSTALRTSTPPLAVVLTIQCIDDTLNRLMASNNTTDGCTITKVAIQRENAREQQQGCHLSVMPSGTAADGVGHTRLHITAHT